MGGGWLDKTKVILNSTQFKFKLVKVEVELGNIESFANTFKTLLHVISKCSCVKKRTR